MVPFLIIMGIIVIVYLGLIISSWYEEQKINKQLKRLDNLNLNNTEDFKTAVQTVYGNPTELFEDATIIATKIQAADGTKAMAYDFSRWKDKKYIGITFISPDPATKEDGIPYLAIIPHQKVYRYKDGTIIWSQYL